MGASIERRHPLRTQPADRRHRLRAPLARHGRTRPTARAGAHRTTRVAALAALAVLAAVCALAMSACGTKQDVTSAPAVRPFTVMLDWFPNADHAPLYAAIAGGEFRAAGLEVHPIVPPEAADPLKLLAAGKVDMAISYEPELLLARDQGLKLVSIGALVQRPLTSIIALPGAHVSSVADLAGKTVGTAGIPYQAAELRAALRTAGVNPASVKEVNVGFNLVPAMLSKKVAATLGGYWNYEGVQLQLMHRHPVVIPVNRTSVPSYDELVLVVREDEARGDGQDLRAFMQALSQGERAVRANPQAAAALVVKANPSLEGKLQLESIRQTLPAATPANANDPYGWQEPTAWASFGAWMQAQGLLQHNPNGGLPPFTNEFLPGQGI
jgi:putative hydroxymethylpyrimidine transport system substrate-binding protein